jgi:hypothetical protein
VKTFNTPKEALLDAGRIKAIGRGRISRENHVWLEAEIAAKRIAISNTVVVKSENKSGTEKVSVKSVNGPTEKHIPDVTILYPKHLYHAEGIEDKKTYGMPEVCNNCRVSLVQCGCGNPVILGGIRVRIIPNASQ